MHYDANEMNQISENFDVCILGAGAAGIVLACELENSGLSVCLIESGGFDPNSETQALYEGLIGDGLQHAPLDWYRTRLFGGSTNCWGGSCLPYDKIDFEKRDYIPLSGWPIAYDSLEPFYHRAAQYVKIGKPIFDKTIIPNTELTEVIESIAGTGDFVTKYFRNNISTVNFGVTYRERIVESETITLITNANVTELITSSDKSTITGIKIKTLKRNSFVFKANKVIIAMGGLETARLMLTSTSQDEKGIGNENDLVGRYYSPHVSFNHGIVVFKPGLEVSEGYEKINEQTMIRRFLSLSDTRMKESHLLNCKITLEPLSSVPENDLTGVISQYLAKEDAEVEFLSRLTGPPRNAYGVQAIFEQIPNHESRIRLDESEDSLGVPRLLLEHKITDHDKRSYLQTYELLSLTLGRLGLGRLYYDVSGEELFDQITGRSHHTGTTRMAINSTEGVVDANCKVFGYDNLFVSSASVFPTPSHANPTFTIVAMAIRLAGYIKNGH